MEAYKKWAFGLLGILVVFITVNFAIWKGFTEDILTFKKYYNGGLDRMGYIVGSKHYRNLETTLPRKHIENTEYRGQQIDVLTIGDSFSNVKENGRDPMYQDWIASLYNLNVLNIQPLHRMDEFSTIVALMNSGYLDRVKPRFVIIQLVERNCIKICSGKKDYNLKRPLAEIEKYYKEAEFRFSPPDVGFINTGNFKFILNSVLYKLSDNAFFSEVYTKDLSVPLFSVKNDRRLLFYHNDIKYIPVSTVQSVRSLNDNFNALSDLLSKRGMRLYFMPAPDKYNMYSDYIVNNPYPKSVFFELLRPLPKRYVLVDTKEALAGEIQRGEKDIYFADDTHWSWKACKKIAEKMRFKPSAELVSAL